MPKKGQALTPGAIILMKKSKLERFLQTVKWEIIEPYLDVELNISSRNRSLEFITLRRYKEKILSGKNMQDMIDDGISKHLLKFYSNLVQGKINITKSILISEYEKGTSLDKISELYSIPREDLTYLRQLYGIKVKGATFQYRKETEIPLTQYQKEILYGTLLGDAKKTSSSSVGFGHGTHQMEYLIWKFEQFKNVASKDSLKETSTISDISGKTLYSWRFYTHANSDIEKIITQFYASGTKQVTKEILDNLTPLSIAIWFQDDGKTDFFYRTNNHGIGYTPECSFCTESFSQESCFAIRTWFKEKHDIEVVLRQKKLSNSIGNRIIIPAAEHNKFIKIIKGHIRPMFQYKINYDAYLIWRKEREEKEKEWLEFQDNEDRINE